MSVKITAQDVNKLRKQTGAGMMDCKKALVEAEGDFNAAIDILRLKGQKLSAKRADRETNEGVVIAKSTDDGKAGIIMNLGCETDFVAKNEDFVAFAQKIANTALENQPADLDALLALPLDDSTVGEKIVEQTGVVGEKLNISRYELSKAELVVPYIHANYKLGVLVALNEAPEGAEAAGKDVAMQIAAMNPIAVDKNGVDEKVLAKEKEMGMELAKQEGKPEAILEKIAIGRVNRFLKDNTLLPQPFVKNNKQSVADYLKSVSSDLTVTDFKRVTLG